jgi:hypothetical protein
MVSKEDWNAAMSSEVFKEYLKISSTLVPEPEPSEDELLAELQAFQSKIRSDAKMRQVFKALQHKLASDPKYRSQVNPNFVEGVMLLDLDSPDNEE